jgi:heme/copper-type cytochrome/quinol oxidase subunit 3
MVEGCNKGRTFTDHHSEKYKRAYVRYVLFIVSEIMFFLAFFWAFFTLVCSDTCVGLHWPPIDIEVSLLFKSLAQYMRIVIFGATITLRIIHYYRRKKFDSYGFVATLI